MTQSVRKLSISVPPDVAERLDQEDNVSAFLTDTVRTRMRIERLHALHASRGMTSTPEGRARAAAQLAAAEAEWTPERWAELRERSRQGAADMVAAPLAAHQPAA